MSAPTVQSILNKDGLGSRYYERWLRLEQKTVEEEIELTAEQIALILRNHNPCFKERHTSNLADLVNSSTRTPSSSDT